MLRGYQRPARTDYSLTDVFLGPDGPCGLGQELVAASAQVASSSTWPNANDAVYWPLRIAEPRTIVKAWQMGNGVTGTWEISLYSGLTRLLVSSQFSNTAALNEDDITDYILGPGMYYVRVACNASGGQVFGIATTAARLRAMGCFMEAGTFAAPSTATPTANAFTFLPLAGFSTRVLVA